MRRIESIKFVSTHWDRTLETQLFLNDVLIADSNSDRDGQEAYVMLGKVAKSLAAFHGVKLEKVDVQKEEPHPDQDSYDA